MSWRPFLSVIAGAVVALPTLATEIVVPTDMPLSVALATAQNGDTITILPVGSPYQQYPGFSFTAKQLTIRGSTGNPADVVLDGANLDIVLRISGAAASGSVIQDLTITNGRGGTGTNAAGAGVSVTTGANVTLRHCIIRDNLIPGADGDGAGIYGNASNLRVEGCVLENNVVSSNIGDGAGMMLIGGAHVVLDTVFRNNGVATGTGLANGATGGALFANNGSVQVTRCTFQGNRSYWGGAIFASGNVAVTIDQCTFADNQANNGGGFFIDGTSGGATPRIRNSLFVGNTTVNDSAIYTDKGGLFTNLTVVGNTASGSYIIGGGSSSTIDNCIFWANTYTTANGLFPAATPDLVRRCIVQQAYTGAAGSGFNQVIDPLFLNLAGRDLRLNKASPGVDAGDSSLYTGPFCDLDGRDRATDVTDVADSGAAISGPVIDIGAYEFQVVTPAPPCPADYDGDGDVGTDADIEAFFRVLAGGPC